MNTISKVNLQNQSTYSAKHNKTHNIKYDNQPNEDTVTISNPSFKGKQILSSSKKLKNVKLTIWTLAGTFFAGLAAKATAEKEAMEKEAQIQNKANQLALKKNYTFYKDIPFKKYTYAEARGIAEFMFDEPLYKDLEQRLSHYEGQSSESFINKTEDVIYLGKKIKEDKGLVEKFAGPFENYKEAVAFLKMHETNPKEVNELKEEFNHITSSEVEKVIPTYQKYPEKTKELLAIQNEIRDLKVKINEASCRPYGNGNPNQELENINLEIEQNFQRILKISPEHIRIEIEPKISKLKEENYNYRHDLHFSSDFVPDINIDDIILAVNEFPVKSLKELF